MTAKEFLKSKGEDWTDEDIKIMEEFASISHPQPAEVSAEEAWKKLLKENYPNDFTPEQIRWMGTRFRKYALELLSLSPHPVRHMSDEEIGEQFTKGIMYIPDEIKGRIEGAKWYRSFIQSQQPEAKPKMSDEEIIACLNWAFGQENYLAIDAEKNGANFGKYTLSAYHSFIQSQQTKTE